MLTGDFSFHAEFADQKTEGFHEHVLPLDLYIWVQGSCGLHIQTEAKSEHELAAI